MSKSIDASLVRIRTVDGTVVGAGFLVGKCQVLTCAHVIAQALELPDTFPDPPRTPIVLDFPLLAPQMRLAARVVFWSPASDDNSGDIAGLELLGDPPVGAEAIQFAPAEDVWEHPFRVFGFPAGYDDGVWATGRLLGRQATNWLLLEDVKTEGFPVTLGFSGGPVWDVQLQGVVGMVVAASKPLEKIAQSKTAFVLPFDVLLAAWPDLQPITHQRIFLSAAPADTAFAERLRTDLQAQGVVVWDEQHGPVDACTDAEERVRQAIRASQAVLLVASPQARTSRTVKEHLHLADLYHRRLILAWVGDDKHTRPPIAGWQDTVWVDAQSTPYETALKEIEAALSQRQSRTTLFEASLGGSEQAPRNPYKGLRPFTADDIGDFFGRERLANDLVHDIAALPEIVSPDMDNGRCLTIIGPSGSGKSSVVMAGLLPRLQHGALPGSEKWVYLEPMIPGKHPLEALTHILKLHFPDSSFKTLREDLKDDTTEGLHLLATQLVKERGSRVVLLVDQFEELFTQTETEDERQRFIDLLLTAATTPSGPLLVLLTLRADFYDRPMQYSSLSHLMQAHQRQVLPMDAEDLRATVEQPAALPGVQLSFEGNLVGDLLFEMQGQSGALPLLQFALDQLFERRDGRHLTLLAYHEMGGVKGALSQHAEQTYTALPTEEHRRLAQALFLRLMEPGASEQDTTRRRAALSEFAFNDPTQTRLMQEVIDAFIVARLLTASEIAETTMLEVSHEAVLREWKRIADWLHTARGDILIQQDLSKDATVWKQRGKPRDRLYRGSQLRDIQGWAKRNRPSEQEAAFLRASAIRRNLSLVSLIVVVLLLTSSIGITGWFFATRPPNPTLVTTLRDNVNGSLRYCINNAPSGSTITFAQGLRGTIELTGGGLVFAGSKQITIVGPGANQLIITGGKRNAIIRVAEGATVYLSGLSFKNSETLSFAFLYNAGTLTITNSVIANNKTAQSAYSLGGGVYNAGKLTVIGSTFANNSVSGTENAGGGGISNGGTLIVTNSTFSGNSARGTNNGDGGGIYNGGTLIVTNSTFSGNSAGGSEQFSQGGGIDNAGTLTVTNSTFLNNKANGSSDTSLGGGIYNDDTDILQVTNSTFSGNMSSGRQYGQGGGIYNAGKLTVNNNTISDNTASSSSGTGFGGGIDNYSTGTVSVHKSNFVSNKAIGKQYGQGGGIDNSGKLIVDNTTFLGNAASSSGTSLGGCIDNYDIGTVTMTNSTFSGNTSSGRQYGQGGGINNAGKLTMNNNLFSNNSAMSDNNISYGGGISNYSTGMITIINNTFSRNIANGKRGALGGGIDNSGKLTVNNSTFSGNSAVSNSGKSFGGGIGTYTNSKQMMISNSIIAANTASVGPDISGVLVSGGYNLFTNIAGATGLNARTDVQVTLADLKLDPVLRNNGGPTQTLALLPGSLAIDTIPAQACHINVQDVVSGYTITLTTDQRGNPRPDGLENTCDIGAYESSY